MSWGFRPALPLTICPGGLYPPIDNELAVWILAEAELKIFVIPPPPLLQKTAVLLSVVLKSRGRVELVVFNVPLDT